MIKLNKFPGNVEQYKSYSPSRASFVKSNQIKIKSKDRIFLSEGRQINQHARLSHARVLKTREII